MKSVERRTRNLIKWKGATFWKIRRTHKQQQGRSFLRVGSFAFSGWQRISFPSLPFSFLSLVSSAHVNDGWKYRAYHRALHSTTHWCHIHHSMQRFTIRISSREQWKQQQEAETRVIRCWPRRRRGHDSDHNETWFNPAAAGRWLSPGVTNSSYRGSQLSASLPWKT